MTSYRILPVSMFQCKLLSVAFAAGHSEAVIFPWQLYCRFSPSSLFLFIFFPSHLIFSFPYYFALLSHSPPSFLDIFLKPPPHCVPFFLSRRLPALTKKTPFQYLKGYNNCRNADRVTLPPGVEQWIIRHCFLYKPSYRERG